MKHWHTFLGEFRGAPVRGLEIGSYEGRSACWLMENICTHRDSSLVCVDPWPHRDIEERFDLNTRNHHRIHKIKGYSHEELRKLPLDDFDFAYIDGDHDAKAVLEDAIHCIRLVRGGGVIVFDDVGWKNPHGWPCDILPKVAVQAFLDIFQHRIQVLHRGYQVFIRKRLE